MLANTISLLDLQKHLDSKLGASVWPLLDVHTIMLELEEPDYLVMEKVFVLKALNHDLNGFLKLPEFIIWASTVANNEEADFDILNMPSSLELAWFIYQVLKLAKYKNIEFQPSKELRLILAYLLSEDGFSEPVGPFSFIPADLLPPGQTPEDTELKRKGILAYIDHMEKTGV